MWQSMKNKKTPPSCTNYNNQLYKTIHFLAVDVWCEVRCTRSNTTSMQTKTMVQIVCVYSYYTTMLLLAFHKHLLLWETIKETTILLALKPSWDKIALSYCCCPRLSYCIILYCSCSCEMLHWLIQGLQRVHWGVQHTAEQWQDNKLLPRAYPVASYKFHTLHYRSAQYGFMYE